MDIQQILKGLDVKLLRKEVMSPTFTKYHIDGLPFDAVIHHFTGCDPNEDFHDHPWGFVSFILKGGYVEEFMWHGETNVYTISRNEFTSHSVPAGWIHRIVYLPVGECWTLVLPSPKSQESGFWRVEGNTIYYRQWNETEFNIYDIK